jgi:Fatty acid hydroxylase
MDPADPLIAGPTAVPRRNPDVLSLGDCWRLFVKQATPPLLGSALLIAIVLRIILGQFDWRDLVVALGVIAAMPVIEWLIHVYLLHARPVTIRGRSHEFIAAREHREHHEAPALLDGVLIPTYAVVIFIAQIALITWALSFPIHVVLGGDRLAHAATGLVISYALLFVYEWCHFLIHTPYRPRSWYYRSIWRGHRLHHFKNEHYWFGVTSTLGDHLLRTAPEQSTVKKSGTARTLGARSAVGE